MWKGHGSEVLNILNSEHNYNCSGGDRINSIKTLISILFNLGIILFSCQRQGSYLPMSSPKLSGKLLVTARAKEIH